MPELPRQVPPEIKRRIWNEYFQTREGRLKLACSFIQPTRDTIRRLQGGDPRQALPQAEVLLRNAVRLIGRMTLDAETLPEGWIDELRQLRDAVEATGPSRWEVLMTDEHDEAEF